MTPEQEIEQLCGDTAAELTSMANDAASGDWESYDERKRRVGATLIELERLRLLIQGS